MGITVSLSLQVLGCPCRFKLFKQPELGLRPRIMRWPCRCRDRIITYSKNVRVLGFIASARKYDKYTLSFAPLFESWCPETAVSLQVTPIQCCNPLVVCVVGRESARCYVLLLLFYYCAPC